MRIDSARFAARWKLALSSDLGQSALAFAIKLAAGLANYVLFALIARALGPAEFGRFGVAFSAAILLGIAGSFGQQVFLVKEVQFARVTSSPAVECSLYRFAALTTFGAALLAAFVTILLYLQVFDLNGSVVLLSGSALCFLFAVSQTTIGALRVQDQTLFAMASRDLIWRLLAITGVGGAAWIWRNNVLDASTAIMVLAVTLLPIVVLHLRRIAVWVRTLPPTTRIVPQHGAWLTRSCGLALIAVISSADLYLYTMLINDLLPSEQVGAFFAALKTVELINLFLMAVTLIMAPDLSTLVAQRDRNGLQRKCNAATLIQGIPALICCLLVLVVAPWLMWVFDPSFVPYASTLQLLVLGMLVNALTGATVLLLQLTGLHWRQVIYQGGSLLLAVALLPLLTRAMGIQGAAVSFIIAKTLWNLLAILSLRRRASIDPSVIGLFDRESGGLSAASRELFGQARRIAQRV